jgi:hypothetical protein
MKKATSRLLDSPGWKQVATQSSKIQESERLKNKAKRIAIERDRTIFSIMICGDLVMKKEKGMAWIKYSS